jgi:non-specific serine/threonine protein kinase
MSLVGRVEADGETHVTMLETVREYALDLLEASGEADALRHAHAAWCVELAERAEPMLFGPDQIPWLRRLAREQHNLRAALDWAGDGAGRADSAAVELGLRLVGALGLFWSWHGDWFEGRARARRLLDAAPAAPPVQRARALRTAGRLSRHLADYRAAAEQLQASLACFREVGDRDGAADVAYSLGSLAVVRGDPEAAIPLLEQALVEARGVGHRRLEATALDVLATAQSDRGEYSAAAELFQSALAIRRELGHLRGISGTLHNMGVAARLHGDLERAWACLCEAQDLNRRLQDPDAEANSLHELGRIAETRGERALAEARYRESMALWIRLGGARAARHGLEGLARLAWSAGRAAEAARRYGIVAALCESAGVPWPPPHDAEVQETLSCIRGALGEDRYAAAWSDGGRLTEEEVVAEALGPAG